MSTIEELYVACPDCSVTAREECRTCQGTGSARAEVVRRIVIGRAHRERRIARGEDLRDCAERLALHWSVLSAMENGYEENDALEDFSPYEVRGSAVWVGDALASAWPSRGHAVEAARRYLAAREVAREMGSRPGRK